jgi:hypothetical protein
MHMDCGDGVGYTSHDSNVDILINFTWVIFPREGGKVT